MSDGNDIEVLKAEVKILQEKIRELQKGIDVIDGKRLNKICRFRGNALAMHISFIARSAVDGEERKIDRKDHGRISKCFDSPKNIVELSKPQRCAAREVADKIIDIFEEVYSQKLWESQYGENEQ